MSITDILLIFGIPTAITTGLFFLLRKYFGSKIELASKKSFADYQQKLFVASENTKLDLQRKIQDFSLYNSKKHEKYIEYHKILLEAEGCVNGLFGLRTGLTFEEFNDSDLRKMMKNEGFTNGKIDEIFDIAKSQGREKAIEELRKYLKIIEFQKAKTSITMAQNYYWTSKLYLSDTIDELTNELLNKLKELFGIYELLNEASRISDKERKDFREKKYVLKENINELLLKIISQMKTELSIGYYKNKTT